MSDDLDHLDFTPPERSTALTLDQIRDGAQQMLVMARERVADVSEALAEGQFLNALNRVQELSQLIAPLAHAENSISVFAASFLVRGSEIQEGMTIRGWGEVTGIRIEEVPNAGDDPCVHVHLSFKQHDDVMLHAEQEVVALRGD